jgi:hypothetical protein
MESTLDLLQFGRQLDPRPRGGLIHADAFPISPSPIRLSHYRPRIVARPAGRNLRERLPGRPERVVRARQVELPFTRLASHRDLSQKRAIYIPQLIQDALAVG